MADVCPTPIKVRYATEEAAISEALRLHLTLGKTLYPYLCQPTCGWWHLSRTESVIATAKDVAAVQALNADEFRRLVIHDAQNLAPRIRALALRDPALAHRWIVEIKAILRERQQQMNLRAKSQDDRSQQWRADTTALQQALGVRRQEAAAILAAHGTSVLPPPTRDDTQRDLRREAGEAAVARLTKAHREEFTRYLVEEFARVGAELPERIRAYQLEHGIPDPEPLAPIEHQETPK